MNRKDEYLDLLKSLDSTPPELEYTCIRAEAKLKSKRMRRIITVPLSSIASFFVVFIILLNSSVSFAYACGKIFLIKDLAQLLAFSPSLSAAVENEYVQPINLEQTKNSITAKIQYVIVDQKQLAVFYSLESKVYSAMDATLEIKAKDGTKLGNYSISTSSSGDSSNAGLRHSTVDFMETNMPDSMQLILKIWDNSRHQQVEREQAVDSLLDKGGYPEPDYIAEFTFELVFDPSYTAKGEIIVLNHTFAIDDQTLTATTIDIYPTHMRLNFADDESNTAWLKSLDFYLENEKGRQYKAISNGISATGSSSSPMMQSHRLESPFFSESKKLTVYIAGVTWLDKDMETVRVDLKNKAAESLPQGVSFKEAVRSGNNWILTFSGKSLKKDASYQLWGQNYYDEQGNEYTYNSWSSGSVGGSDEETGRQPEAAHEFHMQFALQDYPYDIVYLSPAYSRITVLEEPIGIKVK